MHSKHTPATKLTNIKVQTFKPVLIGLPSLKELNIFTVIGMHHTSGITSQPSDIQPKIRNILTTISMVSSFSLIGFTAGASSTTLQPQFTHITASSRISAPQFLQYIVFTSFHHLSVLFQS
jgi:hypothetical protein